MHQEHNHNNKYKTLACFCITITLLLGISLFVVVWLDHEIHEKRREITISPLLDPELNQYPREDMIINLQPLRENLEKLLEEQAQNLEASVYIEMLNTGASIPLNREQRIFPASLTKLPLAMAILKKEQLGMLSLEKQLTITEEDLNTESGTLYQKGVGYSTNIKNLLEIMLKESDNTAYNLLRGEVSAHDLEEVVSFVGLGDIFKAEGSLSATEYARLLRALYSGVYLSRKNSAYVLKILCETNFKEFLSAGFPDEAKFAHKWGGNLREQIYADAGIVYVENRPFMIVVLMHGKNQTSGEVALQNAKTLMRQLGETTYKYVENFSPNPPPSPK